MLKTRAYVKNHWSKTTDILKLVNDTGINPVILTSRIPSLVYDCGMQDFNENIETKSGYGSGIAMVSFAYNYDEVYKTKTLHGIIYDFGKESSTFSYGSDDKSKNKLYKEAIGVETEEPVRNVKVRRFDFTAYVPDALAFTNATTEIVLLPYEKMPYGIGDHVLRHEKEHFFDLEHNEDYTDARAKDKSREYLRKQIALY